MKLSKFEAYGISISVGLMVLALWVFRIQDTNNELATIDANTQMAAIQIADTGSKRSAVGNALLDASDESGNLEKLIIDDVRIGTGDPVEKGDIVTVHYIGTLQNGQEFDNSYKKGKPLSFEVGKGRVIKGWEEGILGMQKDGQRILVIPSEKAYGEAGYGPIPSHATLVFAVELISIE